MPKKAMKKYGSGIIVIILFIIFLLPIISIAQRNKASGYPIYATGFYENKGQLVNQSQEPNPVVIYLLCSPGFNVQLRKTGFSYDTYTDSVVSGQSSVVSPKLMCPKGNETLPILIRHYHRVDVELQGCNPNAAIAAEGKSDAFYSYFTTGTPEEGVSKVHYYQKVIYKNIYPHIDLEFLTANSESAAKKGTDRPSPPGEGWNGAAGAEYNFIVHPGGNPSDIKLAYKGANNMKLEDGKLTINVLAGNFTESIPNAYWKDTKKPVQVSYEDFGNNIYGFNIVSPDSNRDPLSLSIVNSKSDLIIDPTPNLAWGTYYGDGGTVGFSIALDASDNVYITGQTEGATGIATSGAYQTSVGGGVDAFIAKFNSTGTSLVWGTYYGSAAGDNITIGDGIVLDENENIYITGYTSNPSGMATAGAYQTTYGGGGDAFVAVFNSTGSSLLWGTYYGGASDDQGNGIAIDESGNVYITGFTYNSTGMATVGAYQTSGGSISAFAAKFNSAGSSLVWGTYFGETGSSGTTYGNSIAIDTKDEVYITGGTSSTTDIATTGAYQTTYGGGADAFVAEFSPDGASLVFGTYYGGPGYDYGYAISLDATDDIYITGYTTSVSGIATTGAYQTTLGGSQSAFAAKFNPTGLTLLWGTYYGGPGATYGYGIAIDAGENVFITGQTSATSGIATAGAYQAAYSGSGDTFLAMFPSNGSALVWGSYYEGNGTGEGVGIAVDGSYNVFLTGYTSSTSGIATSGTYKPSYIGGSDDAFVAQFDYSILPLPITLSSFTATYMEESNSVLTNWVVASQLNNREFIVEKTRDGANYEDIATVAGAGTTPFPKTYSTEDLHPDPGVSYYRLVQIDEDGNETSFDPVPVFIGNNQSASVNLFPNPVSGEATLFYISTDNNPLSINIIDMTGKKVGSYTLNNVVIGENNFSLNTASLSRGVYFLQATEALKNYTIKFVKE
jgi:hypothetical protein